MSVYFCIGFIDFMLKDKSLSNYKNCTKIFSIIKKVQMKNLYCVICGKYSKF